jgi:hypothetical protein
VEVGREGGNLEPELVKKGWWKLGQVTLPLVPVVKTGRRRPTLNLVRHVPSTAQE